MDKKRVIGLLFIGLIVGILVLNGVLAADDCSGKTGFESFQCNVLSFVSPIGFEDQWTGIVIGIIAALILAAILVDVAMLVFPFSDWVNWMIAIGLVIVVGLLGLIRSMAGWALTIGAYVAGGAGTIAILLTVATLVAGLIAIFWGGAKFRKFAVRAKGNRELLNEEKAAYKVGGRIRSERVKEDVAAGEKPK